MSHASLAARYRPQTFAEVTGQETVKAILSRAAAEDRPDAIDIKLRYPKTDHIADIILHFRISLI